MSITIPTPLGVAKAREARLVAEARPSLAFSSTTGRSSVCNLKPTRAEAGRYDRALKEVVRICEVVEERVTRHKAQEQFCCDECSTFPDEDDARTAAWIVVEDFEDRFWHLRRDLPWTRA